MAPTPEELRRQKKEAAKEVIDVLQEIALLLVRTPSVVLLWMHIGCWARGWDRVYLTFAALVLLPEIFLVPLCIFFSDCGTEREAISVSHISFCPLHNTELLSLHAFPSHISLCSVGPPDTQYSPPVLCIPHSSPPPPAPTLYRFCCYHHGREG